MSLPTDPQARKRTPLYSGLVRYFPDALIAVAQLSQVGNDQHNPGKPLHWDRSKSTDEHDALLRHLFEAGTVDTDGVLHSAKVAWRALAALQKEIELEQAREDGARCTRSICPVPNCAYPKCGCVEEPMVAAGAAAAVMSLESHEGARDVAPGAIVPIHVGTGTPAEGACNLAPRL